MTIVTLKQMSRYGWQLVSPKGNVMVDDLSFTDLYRAELWIISYVSSHSSWGYKIKPLQGVLCE